MGPERYPHSSRRRRIIKAAGVAGIFSVAGCLGDDDDGDDDPGDGVADDDDGDDDDEVVELGFMHPEGNPLGEFYEEISDDLEEEHGISLNSVGLADFQDRIGTFMGTDSAEVLGYNYNGPGHYGPFVEDGHIEPLHDLLDESIFDTYEVGSQDFSYEDEEMLNWRLGYPEHAYGLGVEITGLPIFYNNQILEEAGLDSHELQHRSDVTWSEMTDILKAVRDETDYIPFASGNVNGKTYNYLLHGAIQATVGGDEFVATALGQNDREWTDDEFVDALELILEWEEEGLFNEDHLSIEEDDGRIRFFRNEAAFMSDGLWAFTVRYDAHADPDELGPYGEDWDYFWWPYRPDVYENGQNELLGAVIGGHFITHRAEELGVKDEAAQVLEYMARDDVQEKFVEVTGNIPARADASDEFDLHDGAEAMMADIDEADNLFPKMDMFLLPEVADAFEREAQGLATGQSPEDILANIQSVQEDAIGRYT